MNFYTDLERGKYGENLLKETMAARGNTLVDLTTDPDYFAADIDFIINGHFCELKTDYRISQTGNLFLEKNWVLLKENKYVDGYFIKSKAEYLFYIDANRNMLYIYLLDELREYIAANPWVKQANVDDGYKVISGYCLNKESVRHQTIKL